MGHFLYISPFQSTLPVWGGTAPPRKVHPQPAFQSTLPVWGGTSAVPGDGGCRIFQSTLPVWGGTTDNLFVWSLVPISIHPPRVGRDASRSAHILSKTFYFNPPSPCGEGRLSVFLRVERGQISIHPPRVGRDCRTTTKNVERRDFNPPSPCGEGHLVSNQHIPVH